MTTGAGLHPRRRGAGRPASLHHYRRSWLAGDTVAGLTVWAVLVPGALAYATPLRVHPTVPSALEAIESVLAQRDGRGDGPGDR